jgi:putative ABC transport system permease protein
MSVFQIFIEALESLSGNKLRSGLTMLGIVIGVATVITMLAVGQGAQDSITNAINSTGVNVLYVFSGAQGVRGGPSVRDVRELTLEDAQALLDPIAAPSVAAVAPVISGNVSAAAQGQTTNTSATGVTPEFAAIRNTTVDEGSFITPEQETGHRLVAVIGPTLADTLFGVHTGLVGQTIRLGSQSFTIVGILTAKGGQGFNNPDNQVIVPLTTMRDRLIHRSGTNVDTIYVQATGSDTTTSATNEVSAIIRARHHTAVGKDDFTVFSSADLLQTASSITGVLTIFLGGVAGISLLVGGIGIMNIMLVSVAERTREIGLRKAIGARKRDILTQFLAESLVLSLLGGFIGIGLGWTISVVIEQLATASGNAFTTVVSGGAILLATSFSAAIGLFFGIYPANRAASLQPVEALRTE